MDIPLTCPAGYKLSANTKSCTPCAAGKQCTTSASVSTCAAGFFAYGGASSCTDCSSTPYGCSGSAAVHCDVTKYASSGSCAACTAGKECLDRNSLTDCGTGEYNILGDDFHSCYPCPAGKKCTSSSSTPSACAAGKIQNPTDASSCDTCTGDCPLSVMNHDYSCLFGMYSNAGVCENCPAGSDCTSGSASAVSSGSYSPLGFSETFTCAPQAVCDTTGTPYTSCAAGEQFNSGTNACVDCTDRSKYCPDGIYEIDAHYQAVGADTTFTFALSANQWWGGSTFSTSSAVDSIFSPLLYKGNYQTGIFSAGSQEFKSRTPPFKQKADGTSLAPCNGKVCFFGEERAKFTEEVNLSEFSDPSEYITHTGTYVFPSGGLYYKECLSDRVPDKESNRYCVFCKTAADATDKYHCEHRQRVVRVADIDDIAMECPFGTEEAITYTDVCTPERKVIPTCHNGANYFDATKYLSVAGDTTNKLTRTITNVECLFYDDFTTATTQNTRYSSDDVCLASEYTAQGLGYCSVNLFGFLNQRQGYESNSISDQTDACPSGSVCNVYWKESEGFRQIQNECPLGYKALKEGGASLGHACQPLAQGEYDTEEYSGVLTCPDGSYCPARGRHDSVYCPGGFKTTGTGTQDLTLCQPCDPGTVCENGQEVNGLDATSYILAGTEGKLTSVLGKSWNSGSSQATAANYYRNEADLADVVCPDGTKQASTGASGILSCERCVDAFCTGGGATNTACTDEVCLVGGVTTGETCPAGSSTSETKLLSYMQCDQTAAGSAKLIDDTTPQCDAGYFCPEGSVWSNMFACSVGQKSAASQGVYTGCTDCTDSNFCDFGSASETTCSSGFYCKKGDQLLCDPGTGTTTTGQSVCTTCTNNAMCDFWEHRDAGNSYTCPTHQHNDGATSTNGLCLDLAENKVAGAGGAASAPADGNTAYAGVEVDCDDGFECLTGVKQDCAAGFKCNSGETNNRVVCAAGEDCPSGTASPAACTPGKYGTSGATVCPNVGAGKYQLGDGVETDCPVRFFCPAGSTTGQQACADGKTSTLGGMSASGDCTDCPQGKYCIDQIQQDCTVAGFICGAGLSEPERCLVGELQGTAGQAACDQCTQGYYCPYKGMSAISNDYTCASGYYCPTGATNKRMQECPAGNYCPTGASAQQPCDEGTYNPNPAGQTTADCHNCPKGSACSGTGNDGVGNECEAGYYCTGGAKTTQQHTTQAGFYSPTGAIMQLPCLHGTYSPSNAATQCTPCDAGAYCPGVQISIPTPCDAGHYCEQGSMAITPCEYGTYRATQSGTQQGDCTNCDTGKYCGDYGLTAVSGTCAAGFFCTTKARIQKPVTESAGEYGICPTGNYCEAGQPAVACGTGKFRTAKGGEATSDCFDCLEGYKCATTGISALSTTEYCDNGSKCPEGSANQAVCTTDHKYCPQPTAVELNCPSGKQRVHADGNWDCIDCEQGYYCALGTKTICPAGYYCETGTIAPVPCAAGTFNANTQSTSSAACIACTKGFACPYSGVSTPIACDSQFYCLAGSIYEKPVEVQYGGIISRGYYVDSNKDMILCDQGLVCNRLGTTDATDSTTLSACKDGYFCDFANKAVMVTAPAIYADEGGNICPTGSSCSAGAKTLCTAGSYSPSTGASACLQCQLGKVCDAGATAPLNECPSGHYCQAGTSKAVDGTISSTACSSGYQCPPSAHQEIVCPAGYFQANGAQSSCTICPTGSYCPPTRTAITQSILCPEGHKCATTGLTHPTPCLPGTYQKSQGQTDCLPCQAGFYCPESKTLDDGVTCVAGYYCPLGSKDISNICPSGYFCPSGVSEPTPCTSGNYCAEEGLGAVSGACYAGYICNAGTANNGGSKVPNPTDGTLGYICPAGQYCLSGDPGPTDCEAGKYWDGLGAGAPGDCKACPSGYICTSTQLVDATVVCPAGKYCVGDTQTDCQVGYYCPAGSMEALRCQPGTVQEATGQDTCDPCPVGKYCYWSDADSNPTTLTGTQITVKLDCPAGFYCPLGTDFYGQYPCPVGTFSASTGLQDEASCTPCTAGSYCDKVGLSAVAGPCADGYVCATGSTEQAPRNAFCPQNYYCTAGAQTECPAGTFTHGEGARTQDDCIKCSPGWVCPNHHSGKQKCPAGSVCAAGLSDYSNDPVACDAGRYCAEGSYIQLKCPIGTYNTATEQTTCTSCPANSLCDTEGLTSTNSCTTHFVCTAGSARAQTCPAGTYESGGSCVTCDAGKYCWPKGVASNLIGNCAAGHVCQGSSWTPYPYYSGALNPQFSSFTTYNGRTYLGYYTDGSTGSDKNYICLKQTYQNSQGGSACKPCPTGRYCATQGIGIQPPQCPRGTVCPQSSQLSSSGSCPANTYCPDGAVEGLLCPDGQEPNADQTGCQKCAKGSYCYINSDNNSIVLNTCTPGNVCQITGISYEPICPAGTYLNGGSCTSCPEGKFCVDGTESGPCISGYICSGGSSTPAPSSGAGGYSCPKNNFCTAGLTSPQACPSQTFRTSEGGQQQSDCSECLPGYICLEGLTEPIACPAGYYCVLGEDRAQPCPVGSHSNTKLLKNRAECEACPSGKYCDEVALLEPKSCPVAHFCDSNTVEPDVCPEGRFRSSLEAKSVVQCLTCLSGNYCPQGSINPTTCSDSYNCPRGSSALQTYCPGGKYCSQDTNWLAYNCPANYYCPRNSLVPIACVDGQVCPPNSEYYSVCGRGRYTQYNYGLGYYECYDCPAGTYSSVADAPSCTSCPAGYYCHGATPVKYPKVIGTDKGEECPIGYYCEEGTSAPTPCPQGTYRKTKNGASISDCLKCPAGSYNRFTGQKECKECGSDANSLEGAFTCTCNGRFRAFQYSDTSCRCEPGTRFLDDAGNERSEESSSHDCEPIVLSRCGEGQVRTLDGRCVDKYDCTSACNGGEGVRADETGECECTAQPSLDEFCDDSCRFFAEPSTMPTATDSKSVIYLYVVDPVTGAVTSSQTYDIASDFNFIGKLVCEVNTDKSCAVRHCQHEADGKVYGSYSPSSKLHTKAQNKRLLSEEANRKYRELQTTSGAVPNPVVCLNLGDGMLFEINSPDHYPIYLKDSLVNSNPAFDFGQFKDLENQMKGLQNADPAVDDSFATPYYFGFTFTESGNYVFADAADNDQQTIVAVMDENERCLDPENYIQPREPTALQRLGIGFRGNIYLEADYLQIGLILSTFVFSLGLIIGTCKNFTSQAWGVKRQSSAFYRNKQKDLDVLMKLEIGKEFYQEMESVWMERYRQETAMAETEHKLWQEEESEMEDVNVDVLPELEKKVRKVMRKMEKAQERKRNKRQELVEQLAALEERLSELRLMNERLIQEEMAWRAQSGAVPMLVLEKPALERKEDNEELSRLKREQEQREEQQRKEVLEMITGLKKRREELNQGIVDHKDLNELERNKLLLELEQQQKRIQDELLSEKEKQEVEFRRLLRARAEHQKARKGKLKQLAQKIEKSETQGVDALRDLTREAVENLDAGAVSEIARQIEKEKEKEMEAIEERARQKLEEAKAELAAAGQMVGQHEGALDEIQKKIKEERNVQRMQLMKQLEARKRKLYFSAVKEKALKEAEEDESVQGLLGELLGQVALNEIKQKASADRNEIEEQKQGHRKELKDMLKKQRDKERKQEAVVEEKMEEEMEKEEERQAEQLKRMKEEVENKKENLKRQLRYVTREEEKEALLKELKDRTDEMQRLIGEEREKQKQVLKDKLKQRRAKKQEMKEQVRERHELEQLERTTENVRRESDKQRALNLEEIEQILGKLVKKMAEQRETVAMGVELKEREVTLEDIIEVFDKLTGEKMLEELSFLLAKQYNTKENALNSQLRLQLERKVAENEALKEEELEALEDLEKERQREGWSEAVFREKVNGLKLEMGKRAREKDAGMANVLKERETAMLREMEKEHTDQLMDLREKQIKAKLTLFKKIMGPLGVERSGLESELMAQLQQYQLEKSDDYNRAAANLQAQKRALEEELERELGQRYEDYEDMLRKQKEDERMLRAKRENLQKLIDEKKQKFKKRLEEGVEVSAFQQEEILRQHEAELEAISGAIEQERIRQMHFFKQQMERKKRLRDYQDQKRKMRVQNFLVNELNKQPEAVMLATGSGGLFLKDTGDRKYKNLLQAWLDALQQKQQERLAVSTLLDAPRQYVSSLNLRRIIERTKALEKQVKQLLNAEDRNIFM